MQICFSVTDLGSDGVREDVSYRNTPHINIIHTTGCSLNIVFCDFPNSGSSAAALVFYLPGECTHTDTKGKQRKTSQEYSKIFGKNIIFNEHPVYICK